MLEDDVLAMDGWYYRTREALDSAERQMAEKDESKCKHSIYQLSYPPNYLLGLYLRLFYTEQFLGWNSEEWPTYLFYSPDRHLSRRHPSARPILPKSPFDPPR